MPLVTGFDDRSILSIGHLGIVAGACDSLRIADVIDTASPRPVTIISAILRSSRQWFSTVSGSSNTAYLFPEFFDDIAVERLLGEGITREHLNDDVLGRTLDTVAAWVKEVVLNCLIDNDEKMKHLITWFLNEVMQEEADLQAGAGRYRITGLKS